MHYVLLFLFISALLPDNAHAYVGPGLGLGVIGAIVGIITALFLAVVGVIWYPLKRMLRKLRGVETDTSDRSGR